MYKFNNYNKNNKNGNRRILMISIISILIITTTIICNKYMEYIEENKMVVLPTDNKEVEHNSELEEDSILEESIEDPIEEKVESVEITAIGDVLMHMGIVNSQYDEATGNYNFDDNFEYVLEYLSRADLAIANLETTLSGKEKGYSGYPTFNSPDEIANAMSNSGIDIVNNINNHSMDMGKDGFLRTRKVLLEKGLECIGSRTSQNDKRYIIQNIKGINIGIIGYGYTTEADGSGRGLNGIPIPNDIYPLMNTFNPNNLEKDFIDMKNQIENMRSDGADAIVFHIHWGEEYQLEPNESQKNLAQLLANENVDVILGGHPHTVQPIDIIYSDNKKHKTIVAYSLGNIISNQRKETVGNPYTEDGVIVNVKISKNFNTGEVIAEEVNYIPTWVQIEVNSGEKIYRIVPFEEENKDYLSQEELKRAISSFNRTTEIIESYTDAVEVWNAN